MKISEIKIDCDCGCSIVRVMDLDDFLTIDFLYNTFQSKQVTPTRILKNRLKMMWYALLGKEYRLHEIVVTREQLKQLAKDINENIKDRKEKQ